MDKVYEIQDPKKGSDRWFPLEYADLVLQNSLEIAADLGTNLSISSIVPFPMFYKNYSNLKIVDRPKNVRRLFVISREYEWEKEVFDELISIEVAIQKY